MVSLYSLWLDFVLRDLGPCSIKGLHAQSSPTQIYRSSPRGPSYPAVFLQHFEAWGPAKSFRITSAPLCEEYPWWLETLGRHQVDDRKV